MELLIGAAIAGVIFAVVLAWIIWRAVGTALDWVIATFGNEDASRRVRSKKDQETEHSEPTKRNA